VQDSTGETLYTSAAKVRLFSPFALPRLAHPFRRSITMQTAVLLATIAFPFLMLYLIVRLIVAAADS
jgi:hypothetical protein